MAPRGQYTQDGLDIQQLIDTGQKNIDYQTIDVGYACKRCNLDYKFIDKSFIILTLNIVMNRKKFSFPFAKEVNIN
jgi:hypothetical protein